MSAWAEVDRLKAVAEKSERAARREAHKKYRAELGGDRLVFAVTDEWRFTAHRNGGPVVAYTGRIGSVAGLRRRQKRTIEKLTALGEGEWLGVRASALLVALDAWREAGCPRRKWRKLDEVSHG